MIIYLFSIEKSRALVLSASLPLPAICNGADSLGALTSFCKISAVGKAAVKGDIGYAFIAFNQHFFSLVNAVRGYIPNDRRSRLPFKDVAEEVFAYGEMPGNRIRR